MSGHVVREYTNWYKAPIRNRSMAAVPSKFRIFAWLDRRYSVAVLTSALILGVGLASASYAANNSVQGAT